MKPIYKIIDTARARPRHIVLSEGEDERVVEAARQAASEGLARISVVADPTRFRVLAGGRAGPVEVHDPAASPKREYYAEQYYALRKHKGVTRADAEEAVLDNLVFAAMMVREGDADGTIGGAVATTSDTVRTALQLIGKSPSANLVSSFFLMVPADQRPAIYADCGLVIAPNAEELADIAIASASSYAALTGGEPKVAMLSFSTMGSAESESIARVREAVDIARSAAPDIAIDGDLQFDAALVPEIADRKAPGSPVAGDANVFVFPNLDAGNIGYKIAQRVGGATALGPILQGLAKPANDLSRGCSPDDIYRTIAITSAMVEDEDDE